MACALPMNPPPIMATFITLVIGFLLNCSGALAANYVGQASITRGALISRAGRTGRPAHSAAYWPRLVLMLSVASVE